MNTEQFYQEASSGRKIDIVQFVKDLKEFQSIVIWGAGNLGKAVEKKLRELGIGIDAFWDIRFEELQNIESIPVLEPESGFNKEETLVIFCVANVPVSPTLFANLQKDGWNHILKGTYILQGIICPLAIGEKLDTSICAKNELCTVCNCDKLNNILIQNQSQKKGCKQEEMLTVDRVHFIINNFCNLKCTHCNRYMNSYQSAEKKNLNVDVVCKDIQMVMEAIDSIGVVIVFGGETFLHPELGNIVETVLEQDNFGAVLVNTNGVAKMKEEQICHLTDGRIRVAFSNYLNVIDDKQKEMFYHNEAILKERGVGVQVQNAVPTWVEVTTLNDKHFSEEEMRKKKKNCAFPYLFIYDHKVYPCTLALSLYDLKVADYQGDYVDITKMKSAKELKEAIIELKKKPFYQCCSHCIDECGQVVKAAEQGYSARYARPDKR